MTDQMVAVLGVSIMRVLIYFCLATKYSANYSVDWPFYPASDMASQYSEKGFHVFDFTQ